MSQDSQSLEDATTAMAPSAVQPDNKTRRYDRQLRLWAASGQSALESARILVISATATSTSILKNLVLPGVGHFTLLDPNPVSAQDAGNNFFLHQTSIGKSRAVEAVRFLGELNDSVVGVANQESLANILKTNPSYLTSFTLVITHNVPNELLKPLSTLLWEASPSPPMIIVRSAGFLADFTVQFHEHTIIDSHAETSPSLCIDKPFPALLSHALSLDFDKMDVTDHGHVPYVVILVRALNDWKTSHGGNPPLTPPEKTELKNIIAKMKKKDDEENFDEATAQAYRVWTVTTVPKEIEDLFTDPECVILKPTSPPFYLLLHALQLFIAQNPFKTLPLSPTLPDMKSDTTSYIHLQSLYKTAANADKAKFVEILKVVVKGKEGGEVALGLVDEFVKNCHGLKVLKGWKWGALDELDKAKVIKYGEKTTEETALALAISSNPAQVSTHLALSALFEFEGKESRFPTPGSPKDLAEMTSLVEKRLKSTLGDTAAIKALEDTGTEVSFAKSLKEALGEVCRAPTSDLPTSAALLGGFVAQEAIKLITSQYVPIDGTCAIDLVGSTTGVVKV